MVSRETIDRILNTAQIVDVVNEFVPLKRRGANYMACCPFHDEKSPSFSVSPSKGIFKCFGCGKGGNVVHFIMEHEHLGYVEALKYLGKKYNIEVEDREETPEEAQNRLRSEALFAVNQFAVKFFQQALTNSEEGRTIGGSYLKERGFTSKTIESFSLGWAPSIGDSLSGAALHNGYSKENLIDVGLSYEERESGRLIDRFYERVIFPIHSVSGKVIAFGGRVLKGEKRVAKYINSPESDIYHKSSSLYGLFQAKSAIIKEQKCYLVEGYTDVLSFYQAGVENCVASSGTSLTVEQIRLIRRFASDVTLVYDSDFAGIKASLRGLDMLLEEGLNVRIVLLPEGEDPDSFAKKRDGERLKEDLKELEADFIQVKIKLFEKEEGNDPLKRSNLIRGVVGSISKIPDAIGRTSYLQEAALQLGLDENILIDETGKLLRERERFSLSKRRERADKESTQPQIKEGREENEGRIPLFVTEIYYEPAEREILYYLLKFGHLPLAKEEITVSDYILRELQNDDLELTNLLHKEIFDLYFSNRDKSCEEIHKILFNHNDSQIVAVVSDLLHTQYTLSVKVFVESLTPELQQLSAAVPKAIALYKAKITSIAYQNLFKELKEAEERRDEVLKNELMKRLQILMQVRNHFSKELNRITI